MTGRIDWQQLLSESLALELSPTQELPTRAEEPAAAGARKASVLIAVVDNVEPFIWFTQRSTALRHHPGQISFPGGSKEPSDASDAAAALREAWEEVGLDPDAVQILGRLPSHATVTGFVISPFVGWVSGDATVAADRQEVARLFPVPLSYAMNVEHYHARTIHRNGRDYTIYAIDFEGDHIWGATAGMLLGLAQRVALARGLRFALPQPQAE